MKLHTQISQGSLEWHEIRRGRFGGGSAHLFAVNGRKDPDGLGDGLVKEIIYKVADRFFNDDIEPYLSDAMERGTSLEPLAREEYEKANFCSVDQIGYIESGDWFGVSPDGLVGKDGAIEIKCPLAPEYVRTLIGGEIKKEYYCQIQWLLWLTGRKWCDYIVYHPDADLIVKRYERDEELINTFSERAEIVKARINEIVNQLPEHLK